MRVLFDLIKQYIGKLFTYPLVNLSEGHVLILIFFAYCFYFIKLNEFFV